MTPEQRMRFMTMVCDWEGRKTPEGRISAMSVLISFVERLEHFAAHRGTCGAVDPCAPGGSCVCPAGPADCARPSVWCSCGPGGYTNSKSCCKVEETCGAVDASDLDACGDCNDCNDCNS